MHKPNSDMSISNILGANIPRDEMLVRIKAKPDTYSKFLSFSPEDQERVLAYLCGERSLQILSDKFFKKILSPTETPERVESLLSAIYGQEVEIKDVLPLEGVRIVDASQVVMDIIVRLEDGSTAAIEMQRVGYLFPGERTSCYLADMMMRQYEKTRSEKGASFSYRDIKPVNLIVIMDNSSREFLKVAPTYIHKMETRYSSGANIKTLENVTYVSLDSFRKTRENRATDGFSELEAWLTFFTGDTPEDVLSLVREWPMFMSMYQDIANFRKQPEEVIGMFSEALQILDRNTTKYMIDTMKQSIEDLTQENVEKDQVVAELRNNLAEKDNTIAEMDKTIAEKDRIIAELRAKSNN